MTARVTVEVDGSIEVLSDYEVESLLSALRRDARAEENKIGTDEYGLFHRVNAGRDRSLLQLIQPKHFTSNAVSIPEKRAA